MVLIGDCEAAGKGVDDLKRSRLQAGRKVVVLALRDAVPDGVNIVE